MSRLLQQLISEVIAATMLSSLQQASILVGGRQTQKNKKTKKQKKLLNGLNLKLGFNPLLRFYSN